MTIEECVLRVLTNEERVLRVLTNRSLVLPAEGLSDSLQLGGALGVVAVIPVIPMVEKVSRGWNTENMVWSLRKIQFLDELD